MEFGIAFACAKIVIINAVKLGRHIPSPSVENKRHVGCVIRRVTQKDTDTGSVLPFIVGVLCLKGIFQDVNGSPKWVEMIQIGFVVTFHIDLVDVCDLA